MLVERHIRNHETNVASAGRKINVGTANTKRGGMSVRKTCSVLLYKESLCLVVIQFQFVLYRSGFNVRDAYLHGQDSGVHLIRRTRVK